MVARVAAPWQQQEVAAPAARLLAAASRRLSRAPRLNSASVLSDDRWVRKKKTRFFVMAVTDAEGDIHEYFLKARSLRHAKCQAREWMVRAEWAKTLLWVKPEATKRGLLAVAALAFVVAGISITAAMILGLSLEITL